MRSQIAANMKHGRPVTAKVRWLTRQDGEGRPRHIHCTPLLASTGAVGVWMVVIVDEQGAPPPGRRWRAAPPVEGRVGGGNGGGRGYPGSERDRNPVNGRTNGSAMTEGREVSVNGQPLHHPHAGGQNQGHGQGRVRLGDDDDSMSVSALSHGGDSASFSLRA